MDKWIFPFVFIVAIVFGYFISIYFTRRTEGFQAEIDAYKSDPEYKKTLAAIVDRFDKSGDKRRGIDEMLNSVTDMPKDEQCLVNFQVLTCRFSGYLGPFNNGFVDTDKSILYALKAGCRSFVLEIDYLDTCVKKGEAYDYYPTLVVRDVQGKIVSRGESTLPQCNSDISSSIKQVSESLRRYAFSNNVQNPNDPLIVVLYLLRLPPREKVGNKRLLKYYSRIAKNLQPLVDKSAASMVSGGSFSRQQQESRLLINNIKDYEGRVLFFCNSDTSEFRNTKPAFPQSEDLDYLVNLRLSYKYTQMGCTQNQTGGSFGGIESVESFIIIPPSQIDNTCKDLSLRWTLCLSEDPSKPVSKENFDTLSQTFGVHSVPIQLWDTGNTFMFAKDTFEKFSFMPKPKSLRYKKPPVAVPAKQAVEADAKGGSLRSPTLM